MRLRLRIVRNDLPTVNTLWPLSDTAQKNTIAQLLETIDQTFPLDSANRGLEEYVVEVAGFECLHYHEISAVCKDEDEVVVRPLTYAEVRARHLTGRAQIEEGGRKLHDGVAFGRPLLTAPVRPTVRVRPSKRKRSEVDDGEEERRVRFDADGSSVEGAPLGKHATVLPLTLGDLGDDDEEDEEDDEDFEDESDSATTASSSSSHSDSSRTASTRSSGSSSDDSSSDASSSEDSSSDDSSSDDSSSDDSSSDESSEDNAKRRPKPQAKQAEPKRSAAQGDHVKSAKAASTNTPQPGSLPHDGQAKTHSRNLRRRDSKKLAWLKSQNILPANADLKAFREWESTNPWPSTAPSMTKRGDSMDTSSATLNGGDGKDMSEASFEADLAARREQLLQSIASGGVELGVNGKAVGGDEDEGPEVQSNKVAAENAALAERLQQESIEHMAAKDAAQAAASNRRSLDMSSAERLLYGSLGLRAPKTQEQKDAIQQKLAARLGTAAPKVKSAKQPQQPALEEQEIDDEDTGDWRSKIELSAVECAEEGVELSTPPFPFYQRWDSQYRRKKNRNMSAYADAPRKRRRRNQGGATSGAYEEVYDKYNMDGTGDALDYDGDGGDESYWEEGALLDNHGEDDEDDLAEKQLLNEVNAEIPVDDFPSIPSDPSTLAALATDDARAGDYIVYTEMVLSPATNWQPQMLMRTVKLLEKEGEEWKMQMALRDLPPKEYDEDGKRVYGKFEMADMSDDEGDGEDERIKVLSLGGLSEVKLLKRGDGDAEMAGAA